MTFFRENKAMHEENFLSSWLKEVGQDKERQMDVTGRLNKR